MPKISPLAIVENTAKLADDVVVGAFSYIGGEVELAAGCLIENNVTILGQTFLGEKTHVYPMTSIGTPDPLGGQYGVCRLGEANTIREHVTIYSRAGRETRIGNDNLIMIGCVIGAAAQIAHHGIFDNSSHIGSEAVVEDYVRMSGFASVTPGMTVGAYTFVTAYASVDRNAPPYAMMQGCPLRVRGVNTRNLKRCGFDEDDIHAIKVAFRELFNGSDESVAPEALTKLAQGDNPYVRRLAQAMLKKQPQEPTDG